MKLPLILHFKMCEKNLEFNHPLDREYGSFEEGYNTCYKDLMELVGPYLDHMAVNAGVIPTKLAMEEARALRRELGLEE